VCDDGLGTKLLVGWQACVAVRVGGRPGPVIDFCGPRTIVGTKADERTTYKHAAGHGEADDEASVGFVFL
jgi:hypothetical protein